MVRDVYDLIGIGFGPANLALAIAIEESPRGRGLSRLFLERKPGFAWHPGMMLEGSQIQVPILKDLATVRNPRSHYTFLNYLKIKGRLCDFINLRELFPTRLEYNDYLSWIAGHFEGVARYGCEVTSVSAVPGSDRIERLRLTARDVEAGEVLEYDTRNLVVALGGTPSLPDGIEVTEAGRAFHTDDLLRRLSSGFPDRDEAHRFVVVGAGQSGAEVFQYLMSRYPNADVTAAIRGFSYRPVDDGPFTNRIFFPEMTDYFYGLPREKRRRLLEQLKDLNYAVVDPELIRTIYRDLYVERVAGRNRARIEPFMELTGATEEAAGITVRFDNLMSDEPVSVEADALVLATGYRWDAAFRFLDSLGPHLIRGESGRLEVSRRHRIGTRPGFEPGIYVQGACEETHGIGETVLSLTAVRAQRVLDSLLSADRRRSIEATGVSETSH